MPDIQGYDYGTIRAARSPITFDELRELEATVGWTDDDDQAIAMAGEVLAGQEEAMVDSWRAIIGNHPFLAKWFFGPDGKPDEAYKAAVKKRFVQGSPICAGASETKSGSIIRRRSGSAIHRRRKIRLKKHIRRMWCHCATFGPSPAPSSAARENSSRAKATPPRRLSACTEPGRRACC